MRTYALIALAQQPELFPLPFMACAPLVRYPVQFTWKMLCKVCSDRPGVYTYSCIILVKKC